MSISNEFLVAGVIVLFALVITVRFLTVYHYRYLELKEDSKLRIKEILGEENVNEDTDDTVAD